jgi:hypothetical protein
VRFRTPATLSLSTTGRDRPLARGRVGGSALVIHAVVLRPPAVPSLHAIAKAEECPGTFGACAIARFPVNEYAVKVTGGEVLAVHVLDALGKDEPPAEVAPLGGGDEDREIVGASVRRGARRTFVVAAAAARAKPPAHLSYLVPGAEASRHVVFDAPVDGKGRTAVTAAPTPDGRCQVTLTAPDKAGTKGATVMSGRPAAFTLDRAGAACKPSEDPAVGPVVGSTTQAAADPAPPLAQPARRLLRAAFTHFGPRKKAAAAVGCLVLFLYWRKGRTAKTHAKPKVSTST